MAALAVARDSLTGEEPTRIVRDSAMVFAGRAMLVLVIGLAIAGLAAAGITQASQERSSAPQQFAIATDNGVVAATSEKSVPVGPTETVLPIARLSTCWIPTVTGRSIPTSWRTSSMMTPAPPGPRSHISPTMSAVSAA